MLTALSPLDGRYASKTEALVPFFSEAALIRARLEVEVRYFIALGDEKGITGLPALSTTKQNALMKIVEDFDDREAAKVKAIEKTTNHDVKAVEYYLRKKVKTIAGLQKHTEYVHFGLTSEDVNNLAYGILVMEALKNVTLPELKATHATLSKNAKKWADVRMLSLTHGQPATPTTIGKECAVFADRLQRQITVLQSFRMQGKFGGAVGTYAAHRAAYPDVRWESFGKRFIKSLGLEPLTNTTQINPHDDYAELSHLMSRINTILLDLSRDMWTYISRGVFKQKVIAGEVGSSTMPHKVNPIDFENAEGNFGLSTALFLHFGEKLPISRLQRDLSDSTVQRSIGSAFGYHSISIAALLKGLSKVELNRRVVRQELRDNPEVLAEAIQMVLRKNGVENAYEKLKELTRGEHITVGQLVDFVQGLPVPKGDKERLSALCEEYR